MKEILYTIIAAITFLIPGFIILGLIQKIIPVIDKDYKTKILECFIYSFLNMFLWAIPIYNVYINIIKEWNQRYVLLLWLFSFLIVFISPIVIALIIILCNQYNLLEKVCRYFGLSYNDSDPSAWDFKFKQIQGEWVIITLSDKRTVAGFIGENSFISSNSKERDLYIDEVYEICEKGKWKKRLETDGIWIKSEEIMSIEFFKYERKMKNERKNK